MQENKILLLDKLKPKSCECDVERDFSSYRGKKEISESQNNNDKDKYTSGDYN